MFKPQRQAPGDRDYTGKAISRQVMNLSGIRTPNLLYVQVAVCLCPSSTPRRKDPPSDVFTPHAKGHCVYRRINFLYPLAFNLSSLIVLQIRILYISHFQQSRENIFKLVASTSEHSKSRKLGCVAQCILRQMSPISVMNCSRTFVELQCKNAGSRDTLILTGWYKIRQFRTPSIKHIESQTKAKKSLVTYHTFSKDHVFVTTCQSGA